MSDQHPLQVSTHSSDRILCCQKAFLSIEFMCLQNEFVCRATVRHNHYENSSRQAPRPPVALLVN